MNMAYIFIYAHLLWYKKVVDAYSYCGFENEILRLYFYFVLFTFPKIHINNRLSLIPPLWIVSGHKNLWIHVSTKYGIYKIKHEIHAHKIEDEHRISLTADQYSARREHMWIEKVKQIFNMYCVVWRHGKFLNLKAAFPSISSRKR